MQETPYLPYVSQYVQFLKDFETCESAASSWPRVPNQRPPQKERPEARQRPNPLHDNFPFDEAEQMLLSPVGKLGREQRSGNELQ